MITIRKLLITGAAGRIGRAVRRALIGQYQLIRLLDIVPLDRAIEGEETVQADIRDLREIEAATEGIDCVVHLAGVPSEDAWETILPTNIVGTYNVFEAARRQKVGRVIFASTNHVVGFYRRKNRLDEMAMPRPDSLYGVSKVFGEALARLYADKYGVSCACVRIGSFEEKPQDERQLETWISPADTVQLIDRCISGNYHFLIVYGVSANTRRRWDDTGSTVLGYTPRDNAEEFAETILSQLVDPGRIAGQFHGGQYCATEFSGDLSKID